MILVNHPQHGVMEYKDNTLHKITKPFTICAVLKWQGENMGNPRFNYTKPVKKQKLVEHPEHGLMKYSNGWLQFTTDEEMQNLIELNKKGEVEKASYEHSMRIAHKLKRVKKTSYGTSKIECSGCGKMVVNKNILDGKCFKCIRADEDIEAEIKQMREKFKWNVGHGPSNNGANWEGV